MSAEAEERLVPFPGQVLSADPSQLPRLTLEALIQTRPENVGLAGVATNQLPSDVQVIDANVQPDGVLNLNLSSLGIESSRLRLAMAQIVFTATDLKSSGINSVRVSIDGELPRPSRRSRATPTPVRPSPSRTMPISIRRSPSRRSDGLKLELRVTRCVPLGANLHEGSAGEELLGDAVVQLGIDQLEAADRFLERHPHNPR